MQITIPDSLRLQSRATSIGFASVEEYVRHLVEEDLGSPGNSEENNKIEEQIPYEDWKKLFDPFVATLEPGNPNADSSRESIYAERMAQLNRHADSH